MTPRPEGATYPSRPKPRRLRKPREPTLADLSLEDLEDLEDLADFLPAVAILSATASAIAAFTAVALLENVPHGQDKQNRDDQSDDDVGNHLCTSVDDSLGAGRKTANNMSSTTMTAAACPTPNEAPALKRTPRRKHIKARQ